MKKFFPALFFTLLFSASAHAASLYILYDPACMDRLEYVSLNGNDKSEYIVYHVNTSPGVKVILEVGTESTTSQDFPPAQVIKCSNAVFDEKLVNAINSNIERVFMVVKKGNNRYFISPITLAARYLRANDYILYDSPKYRFQFDTQLGTIGENIAYKNPKTEVYFEGMLENDCSGTLLFQQKAEFAGNPHTNIELVPEVGIVEERSGINAADAMRNVLRLEKVNGKKLAPYLRQICKGIVEPDEVGAVTNAGQPADEFLAVEPRIGTTTAKGEAPAVETLKAPATSKTTAEFHPVKKGETLYRISKKYNVTVDQLKTWNNKGNSNTILVGEKLRVAPQSQVQERTAPAEGQIRILGGPIGFDNTGTTPSQPSAVPSLSAKGGGGGGSSDQYHVVKPGETVASIAMRYGYTEQHFREFNNLGRNDVAKIGQTLKTTDCDCPQMQPAAPAIGQQSAAGAESGLSSYAATQPRISTQYYNQQNSSAGSSPTLSSATTTPAPEESFYNQDLGRSSSYSTQEYDNLNTPLFLDRPSAPPPPPAVAQPATPANTQGREYSPQGDFYSITGGRIDSGNTDNSNLTSKGIISSSFSSRSPVVSGVVQENRSTAKTNQSRSFYVVKEGDTLFSIARRYGMTVERLRDINNLGGSEVIIPYQKLYLN